ncbi:MAG: T9SS type A sorting domain-containing protein, partial [Bacteroidia bacterium]|nr:T9SS type A sorting domain-containing protein [Bacteroidia bacterium]
LSFPSGHVIQWDLASCNSGLPLGVANNHQSHNFEIYPNPASSTVNIQFHKEYSGEITIRDINSKILQSIKLKNVSSVNLDISNFQTGMYILEMLNNNRIEKSKIVKL